MDLLLGILFNSIWLIASFAFGWLLFQLFKFVPLPNWLEFGIIAALSFWVGLTFMALFIKRSMGESWLQCRKEAESMLAAGVPTMKSCVVAVICYLLVDKFVVDVEVKKYIVITITLVFWFVTMHKSTERLKKQNDEAWKERSSRKK